MKPMPPKPPLAGKKPKPFDKAGQMAKAEQLRKPRRPPMVPDTDGDAA